MCDQRLRRVPRLRMLLLRQSAVWQRQPWNAWCSKAASRGSCTQVDEQSIDFVSVPALVHTLLLPMLCSLRRSVAPAFKPRRSSPSPSPPLHRPTTAAPSVRPPQIAVRCGDRRGGCCCAQRAMPDASERAQRSTAERRGVDASADRGSERAHAWCRVLYVEASLLAPCGSLRGLVCRCWTLTFAHPALPCLQSLNSRG